MKDEQFRKLVSFLASWQFAVNLAQPFFTVFFLSQLGLKMTFVMGLTVVSQLANMLTLSRWGAISDLFGNKSVLTVAAPAFILCIAAMIGASQIGPTILVMAYLVVLHLIMGASSAGVAVASGAIVMKHSPRGSSAAYLALNALVCSAAAGLAAMVGGACADIFAARKLTLVLAWSGPHFKGQVLGLQVHSWDFYFLFSALLGLYALHRLALVPSSGTAEGTELIRELLERARNARRSFTPVAGTKALGEVPPEVLS
jgi:MFS family permease